MPCYWMICTLTHTHKQELNISHCLNITDEAIEALVTNCPGLSILVFHNCPLLTSYSRELAGKLGLKQLTWTVY